MRKWIAAVLLALTIWILWANTAIEVNEWTMERDDLPQQFDGFRIAQVSDLHNAVFGEENETLLTLLRSAEPDIIVITGDLVDSRNTDMEAALAFAAEAAKIAPCYYVSGNHECRIVDYEKLRDGLLDAGIRVLEDEKIRLERGDSFVTLVGLRDPDFRMGDTLEQLLEGEEGFTILLSHRPERFAQYVQAGADLVFSGHAHGGQVRLPFVGGLVAPNQGWFPRYDSGLYTQGATDMLVSRGLGNSIVPLRINNRPQIVVAELQCG